MAKYFSLRQCLYSKTAIDNGLSNVPGDDVIEKPDLTKDKVIGNINALMKNCINPIKDKFPDIIITSVYRSVAVNKVTGGVENSQHIAGMAADITDLGKTTTEIAPLIIGTLEDGTKQYGKTINNDPEKYFTYDIIQQLDEPAQKEFSYGVS